MAQAPGHRLGQIIGETLELAVRPALQVFADEHGLYLDSHGERAARPGKKLTWGDDLGNTHDLDHVLERGGSASQLGIPVAFIETAWRRYTKHSRNKAQEIQGAILPLLTTWARARPFAGVVLAGEWTKGSLSQLESNGFSILHIGYETIIDTFQGFGMIVSYEEKSTDSFLQDQIHIWENLSSRQKVAIGESLRSAISKELEAFIASLARTILRKIEAISVLPLHGTVVDCGSVTDAVALVRNYRADTNRGPLVRFEVIIRYDNGDRVTADFGSAVDAIAFLQSFE